MRRFCPSLALLALALAAGPRGPVAAQTPRPNLIAIVTDDQAAWSIGAYGNRESRTPNIDRLAREGACFLNAFTVTPVCSPSRASYLTGLYGTEVGITDWITPAEANAGLGLPPETTTWPEVLQRHGYRTALLGKWHLGTQPRYHPTRHGFDHFFGFLGGGTTPMNPILDRNGERVATEGAEPDVLVDEAFRWLAQHRDRPFALLIHFRAPHTPYGPVPEEDLAPFRDLDPTIPDVPGIDPAQVKRWTREYYASIHSVDRNLGRLLARLDEWSLAHNTIVTFTSDHGYNIGHHGIHTKGNGWWIAGGVQGPKRPNLWDTSLRVPLLVRWPGTVAPGTQIAQVVSNLDTFPSVLAMLGIPQPEGVRQHGRDFTPLLRGRTIPWDDTLFGQYDLHNGGLAYMRMIRTPEWKLVRHYRASQLDELYDLRADPGESRNLYTSASHQRIRDELQQRLTAWMRSIGDPLLRDAAPNESR